MALFTIDEGKRVGICFVTTSDNFPFTNSKGHVENEIHPPGLVFHGEETQMMDLEPI
jgi:hypothetical protein